MPKRSSRGGGDGGGDRKNDRSSSTNRRWRSRSRSRGRRQHQQGDGGDQSHDSANINNDSSVGFVTSNPPVRKSSLITGNISNLFRSAFNRGSSGHDSKQQQQSTALSSSDQNKQEGYTPPLGGGYTKSPNSYNTASTSNGRKSETQFLGSVTSKQRHTNNNDFDENDGSASIASVGSFSTHGRNGSRLFYSNVDDDTDSDNSFDERSRQGGTNTDHSRSLTPNACITGDYTQGAGKTSYEDDDGTLSEGSGNKKLDDLPTTTILRFRGFSTSIKSLFLDEALVCASMGCFGLILSNRTEFLLQLRNDRRGVQWGRRTSRRTLPSRIVAYALLLTLLLIGITFIVWGFGSNHDSKNPFSYNNRGYNKSGSSTSSGNYDYMEDQNDNDGGNNNGDEENNQNYYYNNNDDRGRKLTHPEPHHRLYTSSRRFNGISKIRDIKEVVWEPAIDFLSDEWYRPYENKVVRRMQDQPRRQYGYPDRDLEDYYNDNYNNNGDVSSISTSGSRRDVASNLRFSLFVAFLIILGILGRRRRMRTRYYLVRARAQEDHLFYASSGTSIKRVGFQDSREDQYEGACSHTLCGCYPIDPPREGDEIEDEVQVDDEGVSQRKKKPHNEDCVGRGFNCLLGLCCGFICKCWFQCLSICALAQEAREIRLLVPTRFQRVDYITHQPFHEYQKEGNDLRKGWMGKQRKKAGIMPHFNALSRLSRHILITSLSFTIVVAVTLFFNPRASFSWPDVIILSATFLQSFLVIWVVHWIFHKSDLSLDAVIKFFAAGFVIAVPSAFLFEGVLINVTLSLAYMFYGLGELVGGETFMQWISDHYGLLWVIVEIFNAYVVAAVTEELCKYYTFRCVEHPDLIFLTGLISTVQDERALEGGVVKYPFSSHQVQRTNMKNMYDDDASQYSRSSRTSHRSIGVGLEVDDDELFEDDEPDIRTHRQKAAAVTTAMISVAVGLACAENFLYVFLLGGTGSSSSSEMDSYLQEWIVLLFRSIFPVHALAAAMQSVNMIRKFVETEDINGHRIGVGRIILPAVIVHGTFDAILLGISIFVEAASLDENGEENDDDSNEGNSPSYNPVIVTIMAWLSIVLVMLAGFLWYYKENRNQKSRLIELEENQKANQARGLGYTSPKAPPLSNVELV